MSAIRVVESSGSLGTLQVSDGFGGFLSGSLTAGANVTISNSSGSFTIAASTTGGSTIGNAEDGTYSDGLFTDFTPETLIGVSIDRFNEVLKALAPAPAPQLDDINALQTGTTALLSFGDSNNQSSQTPAYATVESSAGIAAAVDVNGSYSVVTSSNNIRLGVFDGATHISGVLNPDVEANSQGSSVQNYPEFSFGDGDTGVLRLNINGSTAKEIDLTSVFVGSGSSGLGTGSHLNTSGSGFNFFSQPTTGTFSNGNPFNSFKHRTGQFVVSANDQRNGWNYARVQHVKGGTTLNSNYIEWVNDDDNNALSASGNSVEFVGSGSLHLSGIEYFQSGTATYKTRVSNAYRYVFDNSNITFSTSNSAESSNNVSFSISAQPKPTIGGSEDHLKTLHITGSTTVSADFFISGAISAGVNVTHPLKSNLSNAGQSTTTGILMYNRSNTSTNQLETFRRENFRIVSGAYNTQNALVDPANVWDSTVHITASNGAHSNGLQFYNSKLHSPLSTLRGGDFRASDDGGKLNNAPLGNPNYASQSGQRTFYRWFKNEGSTKRDFTITINGSGTTIVPASTALNPSRIRVFIKFPSNGTRSTGWLDLATEFVLDEYGDNAGAHTANGSLSFDNSLNATNVVTLGTVGIGNNEYIGIRIEADANWTGNINNITVTFGAGTGTITPIPDLDNIDCDVAGADANLSFGTSKSITGYVNVGTSAGFSAVDLNGLYQTSTNSNNLRRAVFALDTDITGDLNEDVNQNLNNSHVNHRANSFSDANSGSLKLEVNGSVIHEVELTGSFNLVGSGNPGSGTGNSVNSNGSGFTNLSVWDHAEFDNGVPDFTEIYRTGKYRVRPADQENGWNYARVQHVGPWGTRTTNYVEWVNDNNNNAVSSTGNNLTIFGDNSFSFISGVKYFNSPSGSIETRVSNLYKNVYSDSNSAIAFVSLTNASGTKIIQSGSGLSGTKSTNAANDSLQTLNTTTNSQNTDLHVTGTINFSQSKSLPGSSLTTAHNCGGAFKFLHPLKSPLGHTTSTQTTTNLLVWTPSNTSDANENEHFTAENFRLVNNTYGSQSDISGGSNSWNSQRSMNDQGSYPEHATGLLVYDTYLISPKAAGASGNFQNHDEGGGIESPAGNVNYSSLTNSTRDFFRSFLNNTSNDLARITITLYGNAKIVGKTGPNAAALGSNNNIFVELKIPGKTGFLDLGKPSAGAGNVSDGDGCLFGDLNPNVDPGGEANVCTFNGATVDGTSSAAAEYFIIKISASENWNGNLDRIQVAWSG